MLDFTDATERQLITIAMDEHNRMGDRYEAVRELQRRAWTEEKEVYLVRHFPHMTLDEIAFELDMPHHKVRDKAKKLGLIKIKPLPSNIPAKLGWAV